MRWGGGVFHMHGHIQGFKDTVFRNGNFSLLTPWLLAGKNNVSF